jgi:hypothetical protein
MVRAIWRARQSAERTARSQKTQASNDPKLLHVLTALAEWVRDRLAVRTSEGMAYASERYGHMPGHCRGTPEELAARIVRP